MEIFHLCKCFKFNKLNTQCSLPYNYSIFAREKKLQEDEEKKSLTSSLYSLTQAPELMRNSS
jgi:hypothetical protein